ncbi:hypothetical protein A9Q93_01060 [Nonlabens dokdonensis]|uniref:Polysaccharide biosynthesis protein n=1 Tax=Nonlabens dokdonensis TaxID=328515 RepID=A0A1Z8BFR7_9FLAO|nr:oligosaccharide flippase family protein [Nonlabens dokdonensis]OUS21422.1 hypothetical protein A9Q93_01060 [Nonlabens dokdonensis]
MINSLQKGEYFIRTLFKNKIIKSVIWSFLGTFISKGFVFLGMFLVARMVSVDDYGLIGLLQSFINTFTLFSLASFGVTATKYLAKYSKTDKVKASEILSLTSLFVWSISLLVLILSIVFINQLESFVIGRNGLYFELLVCIAAIFFASLNGLQVGALAGLESFKKISIVNIVNGICVLPLMFFGTKYFGILGVVVAIAITNLSTWICSQILLHQELKKAEIKIVFTGLFQHKSILYNFSLPAFVSSLMISPIILSTNVILTKYNLNGYYHLGIYNASFYFSQIVTLLIGIVGQVFYPLAMRNFGKSNKVFDFINIVHPFAIGLFLVIPILILPDIFAQLFGNKYSNDDMYLTTILIGSFTIVNSLKVGIGRNFAAGNLMWYSVFSNLFWGILVLLLSYILVDYGAIGRALSYFSAYLLNFLLFVPFYIRKRLVDPKLIFNKFNLFILMILSSILFSFINLSSVFPRIIILLLSVVLIAYILYKWFLNYTTTHGKKY